MEFIKHGSDMVTDMGVNEKSCRRILDTMQIFLGLRETIAVFQSGSDDCM